MLLRVLILLAALVGILLFLRWFTRTPPRHVARVLRRVGLWVLIGGAVALAATGKLNWVFAALAAAVPLVQRLLVLLHLAPHLQRLMRMLRGQSAAGGPQTSTVTTRFLRMELDHASGALTGVVLEGRYRGQPLANLDLAALLELLADCRAEDPQSAALLEAYLDRNHGDAWRAQAGPSPSAGAPAAPAAAMTREQALEILGLKPGATPNEIRDAHRRLMQKMHPDRGGSDYLASLINRAKDLLLKE